MNAYGGLNISTTSGGGFKQFQSNCFSKLVPGWVFETGNGWGQAAAPLDIDPFLQRVDASEIEKNEEDGTGSVTVTVGLQHYTVITTKMDRRLEEIRKLSGCTIEVEEFDEDDCERVFKITCGGDKMETSITNAIWLMDVTINSWIGFRKLGFVFCGAQRVKRSAWSVAPGAQRLERSA